MTDFMRISILWLLHIAVWGSIFLDPVGAAWEFVRVFGTLVLWVLVYERPRLKREQRERKEGP